MSEPPVSDAESLATRPRSPVTPATANPAAARTHHGRYPPASRVKEDQEQVSLGRRLRQPRTILSIVIPLILVVFVFRVALNVDVSELVEGVQRSNKALLLVAFVVFYLGFPLRGYRWSRILRGTGYRVGLRDSTEMLFLSWLVNCLVPAKLGDVYRAYLLKINAEVSLSKTFGTVFIERFLDIFAIAILGLAAGFWSFRNGFPPEIQFVVALGIGVIVLLALLLVSLRNFGRPLLERLPVPHTVLDYYDRFEEGVFGAIGVRSLPILLVLTALIWSTEGLRLFFVVEALGFPGVSLGISGAFFVAFIGSLLTAVPFFPAGLGAVELGVVGVLTIAYGVPPQEAATIVIVDRMISVFSIIVVGAILYAVSPLRKGEGLLAPVSLEQPAA